MMHREEFLKKHPNIKSSMTAYDENGEKLGRVTTLFEDKFVIEKGLFFPKDYSVRYDDVKDVHDSELVITMHGAGIEEPVRGPMPGTEPAGAGEKASSVGFRGIDDLNRGGEIQIPLMEEDLRIQKTEQQKSEVHLRKFVHSEEKTFTVPVKSEELVIEHSRPSGASEAAAPGEASFGEEDVNIPLMEERVEILTSQHVRETIHVRKEAHTEDLQVKGTVRIEDMEVETSDKEAVREK